MSHRLTRVRLDGNIATVSSGARPGKLSATLAYRDGLRRATRRGLVQGAAPAAIPAIATDPAFRTVPAPELTAFDLEWPRTHATDVVPACQEWSPTAPLELHASVLANGP